MKIGNHLIGSDYPVYIIAEMSANHGQDYSKAEEILYAMKEAGADAVKLQTYTPDTMTINCDRPEFVIGKGTIWEGRTLYDLYEEAYTPWEWQPKLQAKAEELQMDFFSTPFDATAVDFLEEMNVPAYKIASFELTDLPLIAKVAEQGKPIIMATGMGTKEEVREALEIVRRAGITDIALLKCTSAYPAQPEEMNLLTIQDLAERFSVVAGLSDHTLGITVPVAAVALGACIVEKHFILSREDGGPDSAFSLEPAEFREMVNAIRTTEKALGHVSYEMTEKQQASSVFRRSVFVVEDMKKGDVFSEQNTRVIRPAHGLPPREFSNILGKSALCDIVRGTPLTENLIA